MRISPIPLRPEEAKIGPQNANQMVGLTSLGSSPPAHCFLWGLSFPRTRKKQGPRRSCTHVGVVVAGGGQEHSQPPSCPTGQRPVPGGDTATSMVRASQSCPDGPSGLSLQQCPRTGRKWRARPAASSVQTLRKEARERRRGPRDRPGRDPGSLATHPPPRIFSGPPGSSP